MVDESAYWHMIMADLSYYHTRSKYHGSPLVRVIIVYDIHRVVKREWRRRGLEILSVCRDHNGPESPKSRKSETPSPRMAGPAQTPPTEPWLSTFPKRQSGLLKGRDRDASTALIARSMMDVAWFCDVKVY